MTLGDKQRLGVNIDHVATLRNARGVAWPDPLRAALLAEAAGADGITAHLREDRRHIRDADMEALRAALSIPLNFECAATDEMAAIVLRLKPHAVCLVPEKREERTTEGGLDVAGDANRLTRFIAPMCEAGCRVSMFIGHDPRQIEASARIGAAVVELHTGHLIHKDEIADQQRVFHRFRRDPERLEKQRAEHARDQQGVDHRLDRVDNTAVVLSHLVLSFKVCALHARAGVWSQVRAGLGRASITTKACAQGWSSVKVT